MRELKFIHITKCAGTTIEDLGKDHGKRWGRYHKEYGWWHEIFSKKSQNLKDKYDWFMVVRNPYDRILSEYYCKWGGKGKKDDHTKEDFNLFLINKINRRSQKGHHYTEQYKYLDKNCKINIIKFENLDKEFNNLMSSYKINLELNKHSNKSSEKKFTVSDFSPKLIRLINKVYEKDFKHFGYSMNMI